MSRANWNGKAVGISSLQVRLFSYPSYLQRPDHYLTIPCTCTVTCVEASLSILLDFDKLPKLGQEGGVLTPMSALGDVLVDRLERTGRFVQHSEVVSDAETGNKKTV
jgi:short subunit dehydrogenase-like uncharacterized protein